jgi:cell division protein FtsA
MTVVQLQPRGASRGPSAEKSRMVAALDIGSTKVSCIIAQAIPSKLKAPPPGEETTLRIVGVGHHASFGVRNGVVTDIDETESSIRMAVDAAERMAQHTISSVYVNVSGGRPQSHAYAGSKAVAAGDVCEDDVDASIANALSKVNIGRRSLLHVAPAQFHLDDARGINAPVGMAGETLSCDLNVVTCERAAMRNLALAVARSHLNVAGFVISPYAAAKSVLTEDEIQLGVTLVDLGGQTTSLACFKDGHLVYADVIPIGGQHITNDIARGLSTNVAHAERMKTLFGSCLASIVDEREMVAVPLLGERGVDTVQQMPKSMLTGIIRPRMEEIYELVRERLDGSPYAKLAGKRAVLTGGGSQLVGAREMAIQWLDRQMRLGTPRFVQGMPDAASSAGFAVCNGLLHYALRPDKHYDIPDGASLQAQAQPQGYLRRVGRWIAESF